MVANNAIIVSHSFPSSLLEIATLSLFFLSPLIAQQTFATIKDRFSFFYCTGAIGRGNSEPLNFYTLFGSLHFFSNFIIENYAYSNWHSHFPYRLTSGGGLSWSCMLSLHSLVYICCLLSLHQISLKVGFIYDSFYSLFCLFSK